MTLMKERIAVFPGSFDPVTLGHIDIVRKGLAIFDKVIIGIGNNAEKKYMFPLQKRELWIANCFSNEAGVEVKIYTGLTVNFCAEVGAGFILRGVRTAMDFEFEKAIAHANHRISGGIETIFVPSKPEFGSVSSSIVRDIIRNGGDASAFVPETVTF
jgi:pantetheine-phosphate adenylyltransferase